jgi:hypothetical protein
MDRSYRQFCEQVEAMLSVGAKNKGYSAGGTDGPNDVYEFIYTATGDHGHPIGEIMYKAIRYMRKRNPEDLIKIAAWAYLVFKHHRGNL